MIPRSDELANQAEVDRDQRFRGNLSSGISTVASLGAAAGGATAIMPFLNKFIPPQLALKGISKVMPQVGALLKKGESMGLDIEQGLQFIKDKILGAEEESRADKPKEKRNIIEQYDPELHIYLTEKIKNGEPALKAGAQAIKHGRFKKAVERLVKDHKTSWDKILESVYGSQKSNQSSDQKVKNTTNSEKPMGAGASELMSILQEIKKLRGSK